MVRDVKRVLRRGPYTLSQLSAELGADREMVRSALHFWLRRGDVRVEVGRRSGSCAEEATCSTCGAGPRAGDTVAAGPAVYSWR